MTALDPKGAERQARMTARRKACEETLRRIRDDRTTIRTLDDAITAAAMALAPPRDTAAEALARKETK